MGTLKDEALAYTPKQTLNIADLESFDISEPVEIREGTDNDGKKFTYYALVRDGEDYRIPNGVMETIQNTITSNAKHDKEVTTFSVEKSGSGLATKYTVVTLE